MINAIIPKFLFEEEIIIELKDRGISIDEGIQAIGTNKISCYRFNNLSETQVFDQIDALNMNEASNTESQKINFASRLASVLFLKIRQVANMKDKEAKTSASCGLLASVTALGAVNIDYARRFIPLIRGLN